jgi:hypothetical protein
MTLAAAASRERALARVHADVEECNARDDPRLDALTRG